MKNQFLLSSLLLFATSFTANSQGYSYYNSSQYRYNNAVYQQNLYNSQINSYKPAGYGSYSTPSYYGSYGSYNYSSYTPSYNYNSYSYTPSYNSYSPSYNSNTSYSSSTVTSSHYTNSKVLFCENIDANWNPVGIYSSFTLTPGTGIVKIYLENGATLKTTAITAKVYLQKSGVYTLVDQQTYTFGEEAKNHAKAGMNYDFSKNGAGLYRLDFYSKENVFINSGYVTIKSKYPENAETKKEEAKVETPKTYSSNTSQGGAVTSSDYYKLSNIYFFEDKADFDLAGAGRNSLYLNLSSNTAYIEVTNDKALNTSKLLVSIEKKDSRGTYQPYDKKEFSYNDFSSTSFYFPYTFKETGDYRFDVKTKEGFWVNADYVSVYRK
jgi:hypothetical protein